VRAVAFAPMYVDVTDETFEAEVLQRSVDAVVVVDLWAPWCGPCRTLGPIIERVVEATDGKVVLTKVNVDESPRISQTFKVQSIPAVFAIKNRQIVDQFVGALPEAQVRAWVNKLAPAKSQADLLIDKGLELGDEGMLWQALDLEPANGRAVTALAGVLVDKGQGADALTLLARIPETPETAQIAARARLGIVAPPAGAAVAVEGEDVHAETVVELSALLDRVKGDDDAKQRFLDLLAVMGDDPRVPDMRRKLGSRLF
jgi:putative thioredoxin